MLLILHIHRLIPKNDWFSKKLVNALIFLESSNAKPLATILFFKIGSFAVLIISLHKKWGFPLKISSVNVTKSAVSCRGNLTEEILSGKLQFLCSVCCAIPAISTQYILTQKEDHLTLNEWTNWIERTYFQLLKTSESDSKIAMTINSWKKYVVRLSVITKFWKLAIIVNVVFLKKFKKTNIVFSSCRFYHCFLSVFQIAGFILVFLSVFLLCSLVFIRTFDYH